MPPAPDPDNAGVGKDNFSIPCIFGCPGFLKELMIKMTTKTKMTTNEPTYRSPVTTKTLAESALMIALATILSLYAVFRLPNGGAVTIGSMIPIILVSLKYRFRWALTTAFAFSLIKMLIRFYAPPVENLFYYTMMILLDYVIAFSVLCFAGVIYRNLPKKIPARVRLMIATIICFALRFFCHFLSGIIIWATYAPKDQPLWLYSLLYNGAYMGLECIISGVIVFLAGQKLASLYLGEKTALSGTNDSRA